MAQGKAWDKEKVIEVLKPYLLLGYSITKACELALIPQATVSTWMEKEPELRLLFLSFQGQVSATARKNIVIGIQGQQELKDENGKVIQEAIKPDRDLSKWWLERKDKDEFAEKGGNDEASIQFIAGILQKAYESNSKQPTTKGTD